MRHLSPGRCTRTCSYSRVCILVCMIWWTSDCQGCPAAACVDSARSPLLKLPVMSTDNHFRISTYTNIAVGDPKFGIAHSFKGPVVVRAEGMMYCRQSVPACLFLLGNEAHNNRHQCIVYPVDCFPGEASVGSARSPPAEHTHRRVFPAILDTRTTHVIASLRKHTDVLATQKNTPK